ncbi:MAG: hypothetical protein J6K89_06310 [Oscillospiraceae bacterium]|nr:hypothetical protein [Oscillospiraceae bacterium]
MAQKHTEFQKKFALAWAHAHLVEFLRTHPNAKYEEKRKEFLDAFEGGLDLAREAIKEE